MAAGESLTAFRIHLPLRRPFRSAHGIESVRDVVDRSGKVDTGSTDVGDVSWVVPTTGIEVATWVPGTPAHSWQATAAGGAVEVAPGLFVMPGVHELASAANENAIANVGFVVGGDAVAVIDPGGSLAHGRRLRRAVEAATSLRVRHLVITHVHPDHVMGAAAFADLAPQVIGHARLPESLAQRHDYYRRMLEREIGAEPEAIAHGYPTLNLADVYGVIAYYLRHRMEVDDYVQARRQEAEKLRREIEAEQPNRVELREKLLARKAQMELAHASPRK